MMKLLKAGKRTVQSHIVSHVVEEHKEKVEYNYSNESGKKRSTEARRKVFDKEKINYVAKIWYRTQAFLFLRT